MYVTYKPEDADEPTRWEFVPGRVRAARAEMIEKRWSGNYDQWVSAIQAGSIRARRVLLWHLIGLDHHTLRFEDTPDFYADELVVEHSRAELEVLRERLAKADLNEDEREQALTAVDIAITEAMESEEAGKARSQLAENVSG